MGDNVVLARNVEDAPKCPLSSQTVAFSHYNNISAQLGVDAATGELVAGGVAEQAEQACKNIQAIIENVEHTMADAVKVRDVVMGLSAYTNSNFGRQFGFDGNVAPCCSFKLLEQAVAAARKMGIEPIVGPLYSSDIFYDESGMSGKLKKLGVLAVEMESASLYLNAARAGKNALAICTISDHLGTGESLDAQARQTAFTQMMEIALSIA